MTPHEFEQRVGDLLRQEGYSTEQTGRSGDWGIDLFASRGSERLAVQVKMYGGGTRPVNRRMVFELYGAAAYFGCTGALLATNGRLLEDARSAATKLGVRLRLLNEPSEAAAEVKSALTGSKPVSTAAQFDKFWTNAIKPLEGKQTRTLAQFRPNRILKVDWTGVLRETSNGRRQHLPIELFRWIFEAVISGREVSRDEINSQFEGRGSSGVAAILAAVPEFEVEGRPIVVRLRRQ